MHGNCLGERYLAKAHQELVKLFSNPNNRILVPENVAWHKKHKHSVVNRIKLENEKNPYTTKCEAFEQLYLDPIQEVKIF